MECAIRAIKNTSGESVQQPRRGVDRAFARRLVRKPVRSQLLVRKVLRDPLLGEHMVSAGSRNCTCILFVKGTDETCVTKLMNQTCDGRGVPRARWACIRSQSSATTAEEKINLSAKGE